jgi:hypothetical protein
MTNGKNKTGNEEKEAGTKQNQPRKVRQVVTDMPT